VTVADPGEAGVLRRLLAIEAVGEDRFSTTIAPRRNLPRLFGGQVAAQALLAASRTVEADRPPHSLHAYFIRMGRPDVPITYDVARSRDGRSFATRHVTVRQDDDVVLEMLASFAAPEPGNDWQMVTEPVGEVPAQPDDPAHPRLAHLANHLDVRQPEARPTGSWRVHPLWFRASPPIGDDPALNAAALTYVSDIAFMASARQPGTSQPMRTAASLDHAIWFHRPPRVDDWLLFRTESVAHIGTRGMVRGTLQTSGGDLVATVTQEALLRPAER
jgi:acyl-CoA thioesterase-2